MSELDETRVRQRNAPLCCLWNARFPHRLHRVCDFVCLLLWDGRKAYAVSGQRYREENDVLRTRRMWYLCTVKFQRKPELINSCTTFLRLMMHEPFVCERRARKRSAICVQTTLSQRGMGSVIRSLCNPSSTFPYSKSLPSFLHASRRQLEWPCCEIEGVTHHVVLRILRRRMLLLFSPARWAGGFRRWPERAPERVA